MDYSLVTSNGTITLPYATSLSYKGLDLIGRDSEDWNLPIQQNFVTIIDKIDTKMDKVINQHLIPDMADTYTLGSIDKPFKDLYVGANSFYVNGQKVISDDAGTINLSADTDQNIRISSKGAGDIEFYPSGSGNIELKGTVEILAGKLLRTSDGSELRMNQPIRIDGGVTADNFNGYDLALMALKTELPDISGKADISQIPTAVSQLLNDVGFLNTHQDVSHLAVQTEVDTQVNNATLGLLGGVLSTHNTLAKIKDAYEASDAGLQVQINTLNGLLSSDDATLDTFQEIIDFVKANKLTLDSMTVATVHNYGWMSAADKVRLDGMETEANKYVHPDLHTVAEIDGLAGALSDKVPKNVVSSVKVGADGIVIA